MAISDGRIKGREDEAREELGCLRTHSGRLVRGVSAGGLTLSLPILAPSRMHMPGDVPVRLDGLGLDQSGLGQAVGLRRSDGRAEVVKASATEFVQVFM